MLDVLRTRDPLRGNIAQRETFIAQLATLRQWLWLRAHAPAIAAGWASAYAHLPAALALSDGSVHLVGDTLVLRTTQSRQPLWRLPLPAPIEAAEHCATGPSARIR